MDSLRLGYLNSDTSALLARLKRYLMSKKLKLHFCEGEPIVDMLQDISGISHEDKRNQDGWTVIKCFLKITEIMLSINSRNVTKYKMYFGIIVRPLFHFQNLKISRKIIFLLIYFCHFHKNVINIL